MISGPSQATGEGGSRRVVPKLVARGAGDRADTSNVLKMIKDLDMETKSVAVTESNKPVPEETDRYVVSDKSSIYSQSQGSSFWEESREEAEQRHEDEKAMGLVVRREKKDQATRLTFDMEIPPHYIVSGGGHTFLFSTVDQEYCPIDKVDQKMRDGDILGEPIEWRDVPDVCKHRLGTGHCHTYGDYEIGSTRKVPPNRPPPPIPMIEPEIGFSNRTPDVRVGTKQKNPPISSQGSRPTFSEKQRQLGPYHEEEGTAKPKANHDNPSSALTSRRGEPPPLQTPPNPNAVFHESSTKVQSDHAKWKPRAHGPSLTVDTNVLSTTYGSSSNNKEDGNRKFSPKTFFRPFASRSKTEAPTTTSPEQNQSAKQEKKTARSPLTFFTSKASPEYNSSMSSDHDNDPTSPTPVRDSSASCQTGNYTYGPTSGGFDPKSVPRILPWDSPPAPTNLSTPPLGYTCTVTTNPLPPPPSRSFFFKPSSHKRNGTSSDSTRETLPIRPRNDSTDPSPPQSFVARQMQKIESPTVETPKTSFSSTYSPRLSDETQGLSVYKSGNTSNSLQNQIIRRSRAPRIPTMDFSSNVPNINELIQQSTTSATPEVEYEIISVNPLRFAISPAKSIGSTPRWTPPVSTRKEIWEDDYLPAPTFGLNSTTPSKSALNPHTSPHANMRSSGFTPSLKTKTSQLSFAFGRNTPESVAYRSPGLPSSPEDEGWDEAVKYVKKTIAAETADAKRRMRKSKKTPEEIAEIERQAKIKAGQRMIKRSSTLGWVPRKPLRELTEADSEAIGLALEEAHGKNSAGFQGLFKFVGINKGTADAVTATPESESTRGQQGAVVDKGQSRGNEINARAVEHGSASYGEESPSPNLTKGRQEEKRQTSTPSSSGGSHGKPLGLAITGLDEDTRSASIDVQTSDHRTRSPSFSSDLPPCPPLRITPPRPAAPVFQTKIKTLRPTKSTSNLGESEPLSRRDGSFRRKLEELSQQRGQRLAGTPHPSARVSPAAEVFKPRRLRGMTSQPSLRQKSRWGQQDEIVPPVPRIPSRYLLTHGAQPEVETEIMPRLQNRLAEDIRLWSGGAH